MESIFYKNIDAFNKNDEQAYDVGNQWNSLNSPQIQEELKKVENLKVPLPKQVYYIRSDNDESVLIGIHVTVERHEDGTATVEWFDTVEDRSMEAVSTSKSGDNFAFAVENGDNSAMTYYYMDPMNLDNYNKFVKDKLPYKREFDNDSDLIDAFMESAGY